MLCNTSLCAEVAGKPAALLENTTKYACIVEADESMRIRMDKLLTDIMKITLQEKAWIHKVTTMWLVHKFIPMPEAMKNTRCKGCSGKRMVKTWENTGMAAKVRNKTDVIAEARNNVHNSSFFIVNGSLSSQEFGVGTTISKTQRSSRTPR